MASPLSIHLFPNPVYRGTTLVIRTPSPLARVLDIRLLDSKDHCVFQTQISPFSEKDYRLVLSNIPRGYYRIRLSANGKFAYQRLLIL